MAAIGHAELRMLRNAAVISHLQQAIEARPGKSAEAVFATALVFGTANRCEVDDRLRDLAPARRLARAIGASRDSLTAGIIFEKRADLACESLVVTERAKYADAICEEFARMPVRSGHDRFAKRDSIAERAGGDLGFGEIWRGVEVGRLQQVDKFVVIDEAGRFAIPMLSGHLGGANALAQHLADALGATLVLTTASDARATLAVDLLGREFGWQLDATHDALVRASAATFVRGLVTLHGRAAQVPIVRDVVWMAAASLLYAAERASRRAQDV